MQIMALVDDRSLCVTQNCRQEHAGRIGFVKKHIVDSLAVFPQPVFPVFPVPVTIEGFYSKLVELTLIRLDPIEIMRQKLHFQSHSREHFKIHEVCPGAGIQIILRHGMVYE